MRAWHSGRIPKAWVHTEKNNKKSPISSTKLHKIKTAEPILSDVSANIFLWE